MKPLPTYQQVIDALPPVRGIVHNDFFFGSNMDIRKTMFKRFALQVQQTKNVAKLFCSPGMTAQQICYNVWKWCRLYIKYKRDPKGKQWVLLPSVAARLKRFDCKNFSGFIAATLYNCGIPIQYKYVVYSHNVTYSVPSHVYLEALCNGKYIPIDGTSKNFGIEKKYIRAWVYRPTVQPYPLFKQVTRSQTENVFI